MLGRLLLGQHPQLGPLGVECLAFRRALLLVLGPQPLPLGRHRAPLVLELLGQALVVSPLVLEAAALGLEQLALRLQPHPVALDRRTLLGQLPLRRPACLFGPSQTARLGHQALALRRQRLVHGGQALALGVELGLELPASPHLLGLHAPAGDLQLCPLGLQLPAFDGHRLPFRPQRPDRLAQVGGPLQPLLFQALALLLQGPASLLQSDGPGGQQAVQLCGRDGHAVEIDLRPAPSAHHLVAHRSPPAFSALIRALATLQARAENEISEWSPPVAGRSSGARRPRA